MKNKFFRYSIFLIVLIGCLFTVSCKWGEQSPSTSESDSTTDGIQEIGALLASPSESQFKIVYPTKWTDIEYGAAEALRDALAEHYAVVPALENDNATDASEELYEILIGNTNRAESAEAVADINDYAWTVRVIGNKIVIHSKCDIKIEEAIDYFIENYVGKGDALGILSIQDHIDSDPKYDISHVVFADGNTSYSVVYHASDSDYLKGAVQLFSKHLKGQGVLVSATTRTNLTKNMIVTEIDSAVNGWEISFPENGNIEVKGEDEQMLVTALVSLYQDVLVKDKDGDILISDLSKRSNNGDDYRRDGWQLALPAYDSGSLAQQRYDSGAGLLNSVSEKTYMMCISETTLMQFQQYLDKLADNGFSSNQEYTTQSAKGKTNFFAEYQKGIQLVYAYYYGETGEARIIEDRASVAQSEFEYTFDYDENTETEIYLYGLNYDPNCTSSADTTNNGSLMLIKQADGTVMVIDGGAMVQATAVAVKGLWEFLHEITETPAEEDITISCWFVSHPHEDHYALMSSLIQTYHSKLNLQRVMFNFPNTVDFGMDSSATRIRKEVSEYFPNATFLKCHTGQSIQLGSITLDVMMTHEDMVTALSGKTWLTEENSTTSLLRVTLPSGQRLMVTGDFTEEQQDTVLKNWAAGEFKCQIVQVSHHGFNSLPKLYKAIGAEIALWPQHRFENFGNWHLIITVEVNKQLTESGTKQSYFAGENTVGLICGKDGIDVAVYDCVY